MRESSSWDPSLTHVVLIGGAAGVGKSTLAKALARITDFPIFDKDDANSLSEALLIARGSTADDRQSQEYLANVRPLEYAVLASNVLRNVEAGHSAIAVAPFGLEFSSAKWRNDFEAACNKDPSRPVVVHYVRVDAEDGVWKQRLIKRDAPRDADKLVSEQAWQKFASGARALQPLQPCLQIDCTPDGDSEMQLRALEIIAEFQLIPPAFARQVMRQPLFRLQA